MPWRLVDLTTGDGGLIRNPIFRNTNNDLTNLNGTMLVSKLNGYHLGIFFSGVMRLEYASINGHPDPHAEDNLTQALRDTLGDLKTQGFLYDDGNVLSVKLSKSPCSRCAETLISFLKDVCKPRNIKIRIKIMKLYEGDTRASAIRSIGELAAAGIVCIPWRIESKYTPGAEEYALNKTETKLHHPHELSGQSMNAREIELMKSRTAELEKHAPVSSAADYKAVKTPRSEESIRIEIGSLRRRIAECEANINSEEQTRKKYRSQRDFQEKRLKAEEASLGGRRPVPGTLVAERIKRLRNTTIPNLETQESDSALVVVAIKTQRTFLETRLEELNKLVS